MQEGYVKLWRKSRKSAAFKNPVLWYVWSWCLMKASYKPQTVLVGYQKIDLEPGQFIFGRCKAAEELGLSEKQTRTAMKLLKKLENVAIKTASKYSIVTICNWKIYQQDDNEEGPAKGPTEGQQRASKGPAKGHIQERKEGEEGEELKENRLKEKDKYICPEVEKTSTSAPPDSPVFITLPLNDKSEFPVTERIIREMSELYPAVDIEQEFRSMKGWLLADSKRWKTKRGISRFYTTWLSRQQDRGNANERQRTGNHGSSQSRFIQNTPEERAKPHGEEAF